MPIYNKISYLNRSMNSVQFQTFPDFELICIDDCSSDNSTDYVIERMKSDSRIKLIQNIYNQGTCLTRINGVYNCLGLYIMSLDPDDLFYLNALEKNFRSAYLLNADVLEYRIKAKSKKFIDRNWFPCYHNYSDNSNILNKLSRFHVNWNLCKKLIKGKLYKQAMDFVLPYIEGKRIIFAEDLLQCGTVFFFMKKFVCTRHLTYIYFMFNQDNSESGKNQPLNQNDIQYSFIKSVITYFLNHKNNLKECSPQKLYRNSTVLHLFNSIKNISKVQTRNCNINIKGFTYQNFYEKGYCVIMRSY